ncbi:hypothetical protein FOE78_14265 [Microlunatus elymi]|uniref:Lipoprotein n=1 Tax=Microlunatus elymi TaxID=2596828 RepID=A0A516Q0G1_9ACTN|nr:hypothetical protein [Microlunatus elymi]QDP96925.1 hypothetical protein FOE78_14265 [Microlunatus elymi]
MARSPWVLIVVGLSCLLAAGCTIQINRDPSAHEQAAAAVLAGHRFRLDSGDRPGRTELRLGADDSIVSYGAPDRQPFTVTFVHQGHAVELAARYLNVTCSKDGQSLEVDGVPRTRGQLRSDLLATVPLGVPKESVDRGIAAADAFYAAGGGTSPLLYSLSAPHRSGSGDVSVQLDISNDLHEQSLSYAVAWPGGCPV